MATAQRAHRAFLNRYYRLTRHIYDLTRKYYLFGRDRTIRDLLKEPWESLIEIGPGTGRNLAMLRRGRPAAVLGGVEASDAMLEHAQRKCPWASLVQGFAEDADFEAVLGRRPDRILFSYCLSMVQEPEKALANARRSLAPGGQVVVVDFSDLGGLPPAFAGGLRRWLEAFHVQPLDVSLITDQGGTLTYGPGHYYVIGRMGPRSD
jgi:S-adenosylmethionine-diacylgycerolhomoserine-N-methlytransferase